MNIIQYLTLLCIFTKSTNQKRPHLLRITEDDKKIDYSGNFETSDNFYKIQIVEEEMMKDQNFFLIFESKNPEFIVSILDKDTPLSEGTKAILMDLKSYSGNLVLAISSSYFKGKLDFFKETGNLRFNVRQINTQKLPLSIPQNSEYKLTLLVQKKLDLDFGQEYSVRIDQTIKQLKVNLNYKGTEKTKLKKLRFQITKTKSHNEYSLSAQLKYKTNIYTMNNIFTNSVGGILTSPSYPVCKEEKCKYQLTIKQSGVKSMNIESMFIEDVDILNIDHYGAYYDRTYEKKVITYYKIPYTLEIYKLDLSIFLIPVTGESGLYVNPMSLPTDLENFQWKQKGNLSKRITVSWDELEQMKAQQNDLYIAVYNSQPGEFSLGIDAHEQGFKGQLQAGNIEAGFVKHDQLNNYLYTFEVYESQDINFELNLNLISGDADLYLKKCKSIAECQMNLETLKTMKVDENFLMIKNKQSRKQLKHQFRCERLKTNSYTRCRFLVIVKGNENHGTHYELSLHENKFHRLMLPGHQVSLIMNQGEKVYLKFSYPHQDIEKTLNFQVENVWGDFTVYLSQNNEKYPNKDSNLKTLNFASQQAGFLNSLKTISLSSEFMEQIRLVGVYYVAIEASTSCSLNLKFFEKTKIVQPGEDQLKEEKQVSIHTLNAGQQIRGEISKSDEIQYYTIRSCLDSTKSQKTIVNLTPIKGDFILFASNDVHLPTKFSNQYMTQENKLELKMICDGKNINEYFIGVQRNTNIEQSEEIAQFVISFSYLGKAIKLTPGILSTHTIKENLFFIELNQTMKNLLVVKTIEDGFENVLCGSFGKSEEISSSEKCDLSAKAKAVSFQIDTKLLQEKCGNFQQRCFLHLQLKQGKQNEKFQLGYTYNDLPFHISKGKVFTGPTPTNTQGVINFVYHPSLLETTNIYFNTHGKSTKIYTKIVNTNELTEKDYKFPNSSSKDVNYVFKNFVSNLVIKKKSLQKYGSNPEILISIRSNNKNQNQQFAKVHSFLLQVHTDSQEILRTHASSQKVQANEWNYFHFFNNGNSEILKVFVTSTGLDKLEAQVSKGLQSRPPITNKALHSQSGISKIEIVLTKKDMTQTYQQEKNLRGFFVVAIKSQTDTQVSLYWNNKTKLNFVEVSPNSHNWLLIQKGVPLYFEFHAEEAQTKKDRGKIVLYLNSNIQTNIYLIKNNEKDGLSKPTKENAIWKTATSSVGGLTAIEILPSDSDYCIDCNYMGVVFSDQDGKIDFLVEIEHNNIPIPLLTNSPLPCYLLPHEEKVYSIFNKDSDLINVTIDMYSGYIDVFISEQSNVNSNHFKERYQFRKNLEQHKFIEIAPAANYDIHGEHYFYMRIKNTGDTKSSMTLHLDKNDVPSTINPGIIRYFRLGAGETKDFRYTPTITEELFEIELELRSVFDSKYKKQALSLLMDYLQVYHYSTDGDRYKLKYKDKSVQNNKVYISFEVSKNTSGTFTIHIYNPVGSGVAMSLDMLNGGYKMMPLNESFTTILKPKQTKIFEGYGIQEKFLYFDMKMCFGKVQTKFYQGDFFNVVDKQKLEKNQVMDNNSNVFVHYFKVEKEKVFIEVTNEDPENNAIFNMFTYQEKNIDTNPYSEVSQLNDGKLTFETDKNQIKFQALKIKTYFDDNFFHKITYRLFLSKDLKTMKYVKNCGEYLFDQQFKHSELIVSDLEMDLIANQLNEHTGTLIIPLPKPSDDHHLIPNTKYYGVMVAIIQIFPRDIGSVKPLRVNRLYYDEFVFTSQRYNIPTKYLMICILLVGITGFVYFLISGYIFGNLKYTDGLERISNLTDIDESSRGFSILKALESDFYAEMKAAEQKEREGKDQDLDKQDDSFDVVEKEDQVKKDEDIENH